MTTNSPNPVGGDVQALIDRITGLENDCWIYENTVRNLLERAQAAESKLDKLKSIDTPPAQLLRPVKLPQRADSNRENFYGCSDDFCAGWNHCLEEVKQAIADAAYEVKS